MTIDPFLASRIGSRNVGAPRASRQVRSPVQRSARLFSISARALFTSGVLMGCSASSPWSADPSPSYDSAVMGEFTPPTHSAAYVDPRFRSKTIGATRPENPVENPGVVVERIALARTAGSVLGEFRNTYYDFPSEAEFGGERVRLYDANCRVIAQVKKDFHDALCVQGSGALNNGTPVSFAKRGCSCAAVCPRTEQKICYDTLDKVRFPWGRGATGQPVTPLLTVAVDSEEIALGTSLYIPEYEGLPRDLDGSTFHDGCFIAQDRGLKVKGKHVDVFTGEPSLTRLWNKLVPSNRGVTVIIGAPKCERATTR